MSLGKNISFLRKQKKLTQEQLADRMRVIRQTVSKRIDALYEAEKNLMETMKLSAEQAMSAIKVSENDREILLKRL